MKITFRQVDAFRNVMLAGTVTEAAHMLGVSQPAVSRLILDLEEEVGFKLFRRAGRSLIPTEEARLLADEVRRALSGLERIKSTALAIRNFRHARLSLITNPIFSTTMVPDLIRRFGARCPVASVELEVQSAEETVEWLVSQEFDFGIIAGQIEVPQMNALPLVECASVCIVPEGHRLATRLSIEPADLAGEPFISYRSGSRYRFLVDDIFTAAGADRHMQYEARTTDAICQMVGAGLGLAVIGTIDPPRHVPRGCKAIEFLPLIPFSAKLIWSRQRTLTAVAQEFLTMVQTEGL